MLLEFIKTNNMKKVFIAFLTSVTIFSCTKDANFTASPDLNNPAYASPNLTEQEAIVAVKKIVGNEGTVFVKEKFTNLQNQQVTAVDKETRIIKTLTLEEFANLYKSIKLNTDSGIGIRADLANYSTNSTKSNSITITASSGNSIKANDELADDGPGPAGLHRYTFSPLENGNSSLFANMNIAFNTNADGSINGVPSLYFNGITLFGWQTQQTSQISFNISTLSSTFAITGVATFGIQIGGGTTIGWGSNMTFYVTLNMDENASKPVVIYAQN
jgi:hypothetical protein